MTKAVIDRVEQKATKEGMPGLQFHDRKRVEILPAGLPAGVAGEQGNETYLQNRATIPQNA